jgi:hypothetical protein
MRMLTRVIIQVAVLFFVRYLYYSVCIRCCKGFSKVLWLGFVTSIAAVVKLHIVLVDCQHQLSNPPLLYHLHKESSSTLINIFPFF